MRIVASDAAAGFIREHGGRAWVWIDPHHGLGGVSYVYLVGALEAPGASKATRRMKSARLPHRFISYDGDGYRVSCSFGRYGEPAELHLELGRFPKRRLKAFWNGAVFVGEDIPPPESEG